MCSTAMTGCEVLARTSRQDRIETVAAASELPKWIVDAGRPVDAGDDFAAGSATGA